jgi:hypothetical protein
MIDADSLTLKLDKRRFQIGQIFVEHPAVAEAQFMLRDALKHGPRLREFSTRYLYGYSRCGKSELTKRLITELTGKPVAKEEFFQIIEGNGHKIVYADLTSGATPRVVCRMMLFQLFGDKECLSARLTDPEMTAGMIKLFRKHGITWLFIDEAQTMLRALTEKSAHKLSEFVFTIENARAFGTTLVGTPRLEHLLRMEDTALERQGGIKHLSPFAFKTEVEKTALASFVDTFASKLPYKANWFQECEDEDQMLLATMYAIRGRPGRFAILNEQAAIRGFDDCGGTPPEVLTKKHLAAAFDVSFKGEERMHGLNPFVDSDFKKLPKFPLNVDEEKQLATDWTEEPNSPKRRKGGKLYGVS